ncbi:MAG: hypothetical protein HKP27_01045 [Myxococcales bacterium]|nr:hypothetical protein [Myxococcales bacterium]
MREIWGAFWFATALCAIVVAATVFDSWEAAAPAFFCFLPIVFLQIARGIQSLAERIAELEQLQRGTEETSDPATKPV